MYVNEETTNRMCCRRGCCVNIVLAVLTALLFFTVGAIAGAYAAEFVVSSIVAISVFAIVLLIGTIITAWLTSCRCSRH